MGAGHPRAFTLIEVVLAIALSVLLMGMMLGFHHHAAQTRDRAVSKVQEVTSRRIVMDRITREIRQAHGNTFQGTSDSLTFNTTTIPQLTVWNEQKLIETAPPPPQEDIYRVSYSLGVYEDTEGGLVLAGLISSTQRLINAQVVEVGGPLAPNTLLSPYVRFVRFQYFDGTQWLPEWTGGNEPPRAIEVALGTEPLEEGTDPLEYTHPLAKRVVQVQIARRQRLLQ